MRCRTALKAFHGLEQLHDDSAASGWLTTILVNVCRDRARARSRRPEEVTLDDAEEFSLYRTIAAEDPFPYSDSLHLDFLHQFGTEDVHEVLMALPDIYRIPLVLVHMHGYATKEVAKMMDVPLGTVLARLHRGRRLFEKKMWEHAVEAATEERGDMISCSEAVRQLWEYLDGAIQGPERDLIEEHLSLCRRCCGEAEFAHELKIFLAGHASEHLPRDLHRRLTLFLEEL